MWPSKSSTHSCLWLNLLKQEDTDIDFEHKRPQRYWKYSIQQTLTDVIIVFQETNMNMWQEGTVLPIKDVRITSGMVHGTCPILVEGNEYIFRCFRDHLFYCNGKTIFNPSRIRIRAVNKSSKGHWNYSIPSDPSDSMIAKIRYSKLTQIKWMGKRS